MLINRTTVIEKIVPPLRNISQGRLYVLAGALLFFVGCDIGQDSEDAKTKSLRLRTEAVQRINQHDYLRGERLLSQILPLDQELQQLDRLAEDRSALAKTQTSLGMFLSAIENYVEAWSYYRQMRDHATEIRLMNALGTMYVGLGDFEKGVGFLHDAIEVGKLSLNGEADPETHMDLGDAYLWSGQYEAAVEQFTAAFEIFNKRAYAPAIVRALSRMGTASARRGKREEALDAFLNVEKILASVPNVFVKARFSYDRGRAFESLGEWSSAAQSFRDGIALLQNISGNEKDEQTNALSVLLYTALGKVYSHNFAYPLAKANYIEAYTLAKNIGENIAVGYLLIAIADCERKLSVVSASQEATIAASTYYEQAVTLFSRVGNVSGEAYATYKIGSMKEEEGNVNAALDSYRRAFDLCSSQAGEFRDWTNDEEYFELRERASNNTIPFTEETYWYEPLVMALAHRGRAEEALRYYEQGKMKSLSAQLRSFPFESKEIELQQRAQAYQYRMQALSIRESEAAFQRGLEPRQRDAERIAVLHHDLIDRKSELAVAAAAITQKYPRLEILFRTPDVRQEELHSALSYGTVVLDYLIAEDRILIFVVSFDGAEQRPPVGVVEVPAYKDMVLEKVRQYDLMLRERIQRIGTGYIQTTDIERVSQELYNYFLRPVERLFLQRVVIIPPREMDQIPFHALTRATNEGIKPLIAFADVSYLPYLAAVKSLQSPLRFINAVVAIGNPRGNNWPLDFELRDIRSFFREASVSVSQSANDRQLFESFGDVLQLSTDFATDTLFPGRSTFDLSSGSITNPGAHIPVADFLRLHPFPIVYLSDQQSSASGLTPLHAALLMVNGSSHIIMNMKPSEAKVNKLFSEKFYSALAKGSNVNDAYRSALVALSMSRNFSAPYQWAQFFKFGK
jgi:tetratricopeptide (TPR) repeat protein